MNKHEIINTKGWIIVKKFFKPEEIDHFKKWVALDKNHKGDLLSSPNLSKILTEPRILDLMKECLGSNELYYFGDSSFSINTKGYGFHKDSKDRKNPESIEFKDENYSLLR